MKLRLLALSLFAALSSYSANAQIVGSDIFLQGKFLEIGMNNNASFGTSSSPSGYHAHTGPGLAEVYDYGHDGWTVGTPAYMGDYSLPGDPEEGWALQVGTELNQAYLAGGYAGAGTLTGALTTYSNSGGVIIGNWAGSAHAGALVMTQQTRVDTLGNAVIVTTHFYNTSSSAVGDIYYLRTTDPDNAAYWSSPTGGYTTVNTINYQNDADHRVVVSAYDEGYGPEAYIALATKDCRAKGYIQDFGLSPIFQLSDIYAGTGSASGYHYTDKFCDTDDVGIGLVFDLGTLAPGDSTVISYCYMFDSTSGVDTVFRDPNLVMNGEPAIITSAAPGIIYDTFRSCSNPSLRTLPLSIVNGNTRDWSWAHWSWAPALGLTTTAGTTNSLNIMALSGVTTYTITGTDSVSGMHSCGNRIICLTILPCFSATNSTKCLGDSINLVGHGDSTGATYQWYGPTGAPFSTAQITYILPSTWADTGTYTLVKTIGGERDTVTTHVTVKPLPVVTASGSTPICSQTTLSLTSTAYVGVGETYSWSGPNSFSSPLQNTTRINAPTKDGGTYKIVTDLNGCKDSAYVSIRVDSTPALPTVSTNAPICSHRDTLRLYASDVSPGVAYSWTGPNSFSSLLQNPTIVADVSTLNNGIYTVTATTGICTNTNTVNVFVGKTPDRPVAVTNAPVCSGNTLTMGATSDAGSIYSWTGPNSFSSGWQNPDISPVTMAATGIYSVTATIFYPGITMGCISDTITLNVIIDSMVTAGFTYQIHYGCVADTIAFTNNSTIATRFLWEFGDGTSSGDINPAHVYTVQNYDSVVLSSSAGVCVATQRQIINDVHPLNAAFTSDSTIICQGRTINFTDGSVSTGGSYLWNFGDGATSLTASPSHTFTRAGVYNVFEVVTDFIPCRDTARETVYIDSLSPVYISLSDPALCQATYVTVTGDYSSIGNTGIVWNFGDGDSVKNTNPVSYAYSTPGTYTISATALYRVCADATATKTITIEPQPTINLGADQSICKGSDIITLADGTNSSTSGATWLWSTGQTTSSIVITDPGTYTATVTIDGCSASSSVNVTNDCYMNIPNVFTPNGDGLNDYFFPRQALTSGLTSFSISIYNRWGQKVFESTSLTGAGWDGKLGGVDQPEDVYIYIIDGTFKDGQKEHHQGNVTLLR